MLFTGVIASAMVFVACDKNSSDSKTLVKDRTVQLETVQEIPTVSNRNEKGTANLKLYEDSTLNFKLSVSNLDGTDNLTVAHVHTGGPAESGSPVILLVDNSTTKFNGGSASGVVKLNTSQFQALKSEDGNYYVNIHSTKLPMGLVRGQLDKTFAYSQNVDLTPVKNPLRPETGTAILRLTPDNTLYYKVTVNNLTAGDTLVNAQINVGATGVDGPSVISLYNSSSEFDTAKNMSLTSSQAEFLKNSEVYIIVTSKQISGELLRGQIR